MSTVEELVRDIATSVNSNADALSMAVWVNNRYREMVSKIRFRNLRQVGELNLPAANSTGTVTVSRNGTSVTGSGTDFTDDGLGGTLSSGYDNWFFRASVAWYRLSTITNGTSLTLASKFAEDSVSAGSFHLVKRYHSLDSNARWLGKFVHTRLRIPLETVPAETFDVRQPSRILIGPYPTEVCQIGIDSSGAIMVEFYPAAKESEIIHYVFWDLPTTLTLASTIPQVIDPYVLKEGVLIDVHRKEKFRATQAGKIDLANSHGNWEARQITLFNRAIQDAKRTSRGVDDITLILNFFQKRGARVPVERTARDHIYNNWRGA